VPFVVTGIAQTSDTSALEKALKGAGLSLDPLTVYVGGDEPEGRPDSGARFLYMGTDSISEMLARGSSGIYSMGGGHVPGLEIADPAEYFARETEEEELSELDIPDSELHNYEEAMEAGRSVVAYFARPQTAATVEGLFRAAGLANVRTY
jgi:hypothetical protein